MVAPAGLDGVEHVLRVERQPPALAGGERAQGLLDELGPHRPGGFEEFLAGGGGVSHAAQEVEEGALGGGPDLDGGVDVDECGDPVGVGGGEVVGVEAAEE